MESHKMLLVFGMYANLRNKQLDHTKSDFKALLMLHQTITPFLLDSALNTQYDYGLSGLQKYLA